MGFEFIGLKNAFSPFRSGGEARVGRSSPHLEGRNEVENRNGACEMEVAAMGSRAKLRTKEGGKLNQSFSSVGMERSGMRTRHFCRVNGCDETSILGVEFCLFFV